MKQLVLLLLLLPLALPGAQTASVQPLKVLFIGNSYTAWHTIPEIVAQMAHSRGKRLYYEMHAPGGRTFERHWREGTALEKIRSKSWDYVVFQNQSFEPLYNPEAMLAYGQLLADAVNETGAENLYFMTPAYARERDFIKKNPRFRKLFEDMQARLDRGYRELAGRTSGTLCPVGPAWAQFRERSPDLPLHHSDASHPGQIGAYLTALMFYRVLFDEPVSGMPGTVFPYFKSRSLDRWGDRIEIDTATRLKMEAFVEEVHAGYLLRP